MSRPRPTDCGTVVSDAAELRRLMRGRRRSKYNASRTELDDIVFDSRAEAARWLQLKREQCSGSIAGLERQPRFEVGGVCKYKADFAYHVMGGAEVIEDVKGRDTRDSRLRRKLVERLFDVRIVIVKMRQDVVDALLAAAGARRKDNDAQP